MSNMQNIFGRSGNPALRKDVFAKEAQLGENYQAMTIQGAVNKTILLLLIVFAGAALSWYMVKSQGLQGMAYPAVIGLGIAGFIVALITIFNKKASPITAPIYSIIEGLFLGIISLIFERLYPGIVFQAILITFSILFVLLVVYKTGIIKVTQNFRLGVMAATGGIALVYIINLVLHLFGAGIPYIHDSISQGPWGVIFSVVVVIIASLNLVLDFDFIEQGVEAGAPKYMEWYGAFGLMVTLIWLYLEILRLLSKLSRR